MKKRTNEEKLQLVNEACNMIRESLATISKAQKMLHLCGIELCDSYSCNLLSFDENSTHAQIYTGISKLERIIDKQAQYGTDLYCESPDKSRKIIEYNGVKFLQLGNTKQSSYSYK